MFDFKLFNLFFSCWNRFCCINLKFNDDFGSKMLIRWRFESDFKRNLAQGWSNRISLLVTFLRLKIPAYPSPTKWYIIRMGFLGRIIKCLKRILDGKFKQSETVFFGFTGWTNWDRLTKFEAWKYLKSNFYNLPYYKSNFTCSLGFLGYKSRLSQSNLKNPYKRCKKFHKFGEVVFFDVAAL